MAATWGAGLSLRGAKGSDGLSVITSSGAPTVTGSEGQAAIDTAAGDLYKYTGGAWVKQTSLVGKMGLNGLNAQLLYGSSPPTESTFSNDSDAIYFQYSGELWFFDFEGGKTWVDSGQNLTGPQGAPGVAGSAGETGMGGPMGPVGPAGQNGADGQDGARGADGAIGASGKDGRDGIDGQPGERGDVGAVGPAGETGQPGADGTMWFVGDGPPIPQNSYPDGSFYFDRQADQVYPPAA